MSLCFIQHCAFIIKSVVIHNFLKNGCPVVSRCLFKHCFTSLMHMVQVPGSNFKAFQFQDVESLRHNEML